MYILGTI